MYELGLGREREAYWKSALMTKSASMCAHLPTLDHVAS